MTEDLLIAYEILLHWKSVEESDRSENLCYRKWVLEEFKM